jgi:hypothetical protein
MRWEYKRVNLDLGAVADEAFEYRLHRLGAQGWELVTAIEHARQGYSHAVYLIFKRTVFEPEELAAQ